MLRHSKSVRSRAPSLDTVWESFDAVDAVPLQEDALASGSRDLMAGGLKIRSSGWGAFRGLFRRQWQERFAVLQGEPGSLPQLLFFQNESMTQLQEVVLLQSPLELHCVPGDGALYRFELCTAKCAPIELAATSEDSRILWMLALGDSVCCPASPPVSRSPSTPGSPPSDWISAGAAGRVRLKRCKLADNYTMGKVLEQSEELIVVEGFHRSTRSSHAIKIVSKSAAQSKVLKRDVCCLPGNGPELISKCIEEVYEGPNHACLVMKWGTHEFDTQHHLAAAVLEALRLLHELLPGGDVGGNLMLDGSDTHRLVSRVLSLDRLLQAHLFI